MTIVDTLEKSVIAPVFEHLAGHVPRLDSPAARRLLLGTALVESGGREIFQRSGGPAVSLFQIEPATFADVWERYLSERLVLRDAVSALAWPGIEPVVQLPVNQHLACAVARIRYWMTPAPLPEANDLAALGAYWKRHYNTSQGAGTVEKFVKACEARGACEACGAC